MHLMLMNHFKKPTSNYPTSASAVYDYCCREEPSAITTDLGQLFISEEFGNLLGSQPITNNKDYRENVWLLLSGIIQLIPQ